MIFLVLGITQKKKKILIDFGQWYTDKLSQSRLWHKHGPANTQMAMAELVEER